jgi:hypothetical protein
MEIVLNMLIQPWLPWIRYPLEYSYGEMLQWVPPVGEREREERKRWSGPWELLARKRNGPAG